MRKTVSLVLAICGTLLLSAAVRHRTFDLYPRLQPGLSDIAETGPQSTITLTENDVEVPANRRQPENRYHTAAQ